MFDFLYQIGLHLFALSTLPKFFSNKKKYRALLKKRLGVGFPEIQKNNHKLIWIHAVSLGETKAVAPLVNRLKELYPSLLILVSTITETGHQEGKKSIPSADYHVFLPFDFSYVINPIIKRVRPDVVLITETDLWYNFQKAAKKQGAKIAVVNGKLSETSMRRYQRLPMARAILKTIDLFCVQGELYQKRLQSVGIPIQKTIITGNLKLDGFNSFLSQDDAIALKKQLGLDENDFVITLGSTHDPEESIWLKNLKELWQKYPQIKVLLVPRHPQRFDEVAHMIEKEGIAYSRFSQKQQPQKLILVDAMGLLRHCYQISNLAFVGGTFAEKIGGHNILEPSFYGVPVLFGPYMYSQPDFLDLMRSYKAGRQISQETLNATVSELIDDSAKRKELGMQGLKLTNDAKGALNSTLNAIASFLK